MPPLNITYLSASPLKPSSNFPEQAPVSHTVNFWTGLPAHNRAAGQFPSHGILPPKALEESEVHSPRACLTRYVPLPGFHTLLGVSSSRNRPVLFHTGNAPGVSPSGLFPLHGYGTLSSLVTLLTLPSGFPTGSKAVRNKPSSATRKAPCRIPRSSVQTAVFRVLLSARVRAANE
jgi:hypothetical protein